MFGQEYEGQVELVSSAEHIAPIVQTINLIGKSHGTECAYWSISLQNTLKHTHMTTFVNK